MGLKIAIWLITTIIAILGIDWKEHKAKTISIAFLLIAAIVLTIIDYNIEQENSNVKEMAARKQRKNDSLLSLEQQEDLHHHIESLKQTHVADSLRIVMLNMSINDYKAKNLNIGTNNGHIGDVVSERELTEQDKVNIIKDISKAKKQFNIKNNDVILGISNDSNAGKFYGQLRLFLISKGHNIIGTLNGLGSTEPSKGISFFVPNIEGTRHALGIYIGVL